MYVLRVNINMSGWRINQSVSCGIPTLRRPQWWVRFVDGIPWIDELWTISSVQLELLIKVWDHSQRWAHTHIPTTISHLTWPDTATSNWIMWIRLVQSAHVSNQCVQWLMTQSLGRAEIWDTFCLNLCLLTSRSQSTSKIPYALASLIDWMWITLE